MPLLIGIFARLGLPERFRRAAATFAAIVLVAGLCALLWTCWLGKHDRGVVERHEAAIVKQVTAATEAANDTANRNDAARQADNARADQETKDAIRRAEQAHPEAARAAAGPAARAAADSLRKHRAGAARPAAD